MGKTIVYWKWLKKKPNVFVEYGIDREHHKNNRIFGVSSEIEEIAPDGKEIEYRVPKKVPIKTCEIYLRIWVGKFVICFGSGSFSMKIKNHRSFKILFGRSGILKAELSDVLTHPVETSDLEMTDGEAPNDLIQSAETPKVENQRKE